MTVLSDSELRSPGVGREPLCVNYIIFYIYGMKVTLERDDGQWSWLCVNSMYGPTPYLGCVLLALRVGAPAALGVGVGVVCVGGYGCDVCGWMCV